MRMIMGVIGILLSTSFFSSAQALTGYLKSPLVSPITHEKEFFRGSWSHFPHELLNNWHLRSGLYTSVTAFSLENIPVCLIPYAVYKKRYKLALFAGVAFLVTRATLFAGLVAASKEHEGDLPLFDADEARMFGWSDEMYFAYKAHWEAINGARLTLVKELDSLPEDQLKDYSIRYWDDFFSDLGSIGEGTENEKLANFKAAENAKQAFGSIAPIVTQLLVCNDSFSN